MAKPKRRRAAAKPRAAKPGGVKRRSAGQRTGKKVADAIKPRNKTEACLALLARPEGATLEELQGVTGWQPHSVRGLLAGTIKKIPGLTLESEKLKDGPRRYRVRRSHE